MYEISKASYKGFVFEPLFGTGHGSGASPSVWLSLIVILLNTFDHVVPKGIQFSLPDLKHSHEQIVDAFVDDTSIGFTLDGNMPYGDMIDRIKQIAQTWENLWHFSGGSINLKKCLWYNLYWDWDQGRPILQHSSKDDPTISLRQSESNQSFTIKQTSHDEAIRMLGVRLSPVGNFSKHKSILKNRMDEYSVSLRSLNLSHSDVTVFHRSKYKPAVRHSLPAVASNAKALQMLQSKVIPTILQRLSFTSKLLTAIRHGPEGLGGLELIDISTESGIERISFFRHHAIYSQSNVGKLLLINVKTLQLEAGVEFPLLKQPTIHIPYLTTTWITSLRNFLALHNISITSTDQGPSPLKSSSNSYIMNLPALTQYTIRQQRDINLVCLHL